MFAIGSRTIYDKVGTYRNVTPTYAQPLLNGSGAELEWRWSACREVSSKPYLSIVNIGRLLRSEALELTVDNGFAFGSD
ncbi:hypothetical protein Tco_0178322 [Tanacetum coccineum]